MTGAPVSREAVLDRIEDLCGSVAVTRNEGSVTCFVDEAARGNAFVHLVTTPGGVMVYVGRDAIDEPSVLPTRDQAGRPVGDARVAAPTVADHVRDRWDRLRSEFTERERGLSWFAREPILAEALLGQEEPPTTDERLEPDLRRDLDRRDESVVDGAGSLPQRYQGWFDWRFPLYRREWPDVSFEVVVQRAYHQVDSR